MTAHHLYRCFGGDGRLVYVGVTRNFDGRLRYHSANSWWSSRVVKVRAVVYRDGASARDAERHAIKTERPRFNIMSQYPTAAWSRDEWLDYITAYRNASWLTSHRRNGLAKLERLFTARFGEAAA